MNKYADIPYRHFGRDFDGCDCYGLLILYFKTELGITLLDYQYNVDQAGHLDDSSLLLQNYHCEWTRISPEEVKQHDVVLLLNELKYPTHCGVMIQRRRFMHCMLDHGIIVSKTSTWRKAIHSFYRHKSQL